jgi:lipopolysaccharide export system permease protein
MSKEDTVRMEKQLAETESFHVDSLYAKLSVEQKLRVTKEALRQSQNVVSDMQLKADYTEWVNRQARVHMMEAINKFTLSLSCIIFFFIGAPLGAIIRKGGLGVPVIISVIVFIVYYIFENSGMRMARADEWTVWFGKWISTMVLAPMAIFFTYQSNKDSAVFNIDAYRMLIMRLLGLRTKRNIAKKEVIIEDPKYLMDADMLTNVNVDIGKYSEIHKLLRWPNPISVFFRPGNDHEIEHINSVLETAIEDLSYSRNNYVLMKLNQFPVIATRAHTRPFERKWLNVITGLFLPTGIFFYFRMIRFRLRLYKDLRDIIRINKKLIPKVIELGDVKEEGKAFTES